MVELFQERIINYEKGLKRLSKGRNNYRDLNQKLSQEIDNLKSKLDNQTQTLREQSRIISISEEVESTLHQKNKKLSQQKATALEKLRQLKSDYRTSQAQNKTSQKQNDQLAKENNNLTEQLLEKIGKLTGEQTKTKKLTKANRARAILLVAGQKKVKDLGDAKTNLITLINRVQNYLGVPDLTQITTPLPDQKSLDDLITFYQDNKDKDSAPTPTRTIIESGEPNETLIVNQIIQECDLGLAENSPLTQVISRIKKLIKTKPKPVFQSVFKNDTPFGESLENIIQIDLHSLEQELGINLSKSTKDQIQKATNYQELSLLRNQEIKSHLEKSQGDMIITQPPNQPSTLFKEERIL